MRREKCRWTHITSEEVKRHIARNPTVLLPVGATEQHSEYSVCGTDYLQAEYVALEAGRRTDTLVLPPIPFGNSHYHSAFMGTVSVRPMTLVSLLLDVIESLSFQAVRRLIVVNGHGGNIPIIQTAFHEAKVKGVWMELELVSWFLLPEVRELEERLYGERNGYHVTCGEVACNLAMFEDFEIEGKDYTHRKGEFSVMHAEEFRLSFPEGVCWSDLTLVRREHGEKLLEAGVRGLCRVIEKKKEVVR